MGTYNIRKAKLMTFNEEFYNRFHHFCLKYLPAEHWIKPEHVAGLVFVENDKLDPKASRFEPSVYKSVDFVFKGNRSSAYPGFNNGPLYEVIRKSNEKQRKAIASSWGLGQLMGYHYIDKFNMHPDDFTNMDDEASIKTTIKFMLANSGQVKTPYITSGINKYEPYEQLLRLHNTGSTTGKTYHDDYVMRASESRAFYKADSDKFQAIKPVVSIPTQPLNPHFSEFATLLTVLSHDVYKDNEAKGFWEKPRSNAECIALMHSELSEALEGDRKSLADSHLPQYDSLTVELADCIIRIMDLAGKLNLSLGAALVDKLKYNRSRPYKHGKAY